MMRVGKPVELNSPRGDDDKTDLAADDLAVDPVSRIDLHDALTDESHPTTHEAAGRGCVVPT